ncbi:MAG: DUF11 domain-containing protein [Dehalococcoidia bacterium]|nr:MAG: DUF11 domain-containing protein [Dehalococcoidia bacterium]
MRRHHVFAFVKRASWKAGTVTLAALMALALVAQTNEPTRAEASVGPNIASQATTLLVSVTNPLGVSSHDLNVMRDGYSGPTAFSYDTWDGNNAANGEDFYGYGWDTPQQVARVVFTEGYVFPDGGFFNTIRLETSPDGTTWTTVAGGNDASPPYPNGNDGIPFNSYQWDFVPAITAKYIRVIGGAGGTAEFTSVSEFQVFVPGGVVPIDNIAPYADFVGTSVFPTTGNGSRDLEVLRDGIKPAPGSFNPSLQFDTNIGAPNSGDVFFLYRWPTQRTITRIELYGGQETAEGGWWSNLRIELSSNGNDWNLMKTAADAVPVYPNAASQSFNHYTFTFATPRSGKYMRIIGPAGGSPGYISASEIEVYAELEPGEGGYYPNIAPSALEIFGSHMAGVGQGAPTLSVLNNGYAPGVDAVEPLAQFDTWNGLNAATGPDWYAYRFNTTKIFTGAAYTEGMQFTDGGWFVGGPHIEVSGDGSTWTTVPATISPAYVNDDGHNFNRYVFNFTAPVSGRYIRLIGTAGGASEFTSVAEFEVYGGDITASNSVNLTLGQTVDNPTPNVGTQVTFTVTLTSHNLTPATGITIADALPAGLTLVSWVTSNGTYAANVWTVPTLAGNGSATLTLVATVNSGTNGQTITNNASISTSNQINTGTPTSASSSITVAALLGDPNIAPLANLLITSVPAPLGGGNHNLEIICDISYPTPGTNNAGAQYDTWDANTPSGPDYFGYRWPARYHFSGAKFVDGMHFGDGGYFASAPRIEVSDDGTTWTTVTTVSGYQGNTVPNFTAYPLTFSADGRYLRLIGTAGGGAEFTSIAELEVYGTLIPGAPDVRITVTVDNPTPTVGTNVTITIKARNVGTAGATGVSVPWTLPAGLTLVSTTPNTGSPWNVGNLAVDEEQTLVIVATVTGTPGQPIVVTAGPVTCTGSCGAGPGTGTVTITPTGVLGDPNIAPLANLLITSVPAPLGGGNHNLEIIRDLSYPTPGTNNAGAQYDTFDGFAPSGPDYFGYRWPDRYHFTGAKFVDGMHFGDGGYFASAPRIEVSDDGVTWTTVATVTGYQGNAAPNFTAYNIPFTADGRYLRLIGTAAGGAEFTSIAELEVYGTLIPGAPDVRITVTVDNPTPTVGTNVTITIKAKNVGTLGATGVSVPWTLPAGLTLVSTTPNTGSPWNIGDLAVDEEQTLVIVATVTGTPGQPIVVTAGPVSCTSSCGSGGTVTVTITPVGVLGDPNIAPLANLLITSVPAPLGGGNHNLEVIRDISYPIPGSNNAGAQYDTFDFFAPSGPDYFGYRWANRYHFTGAKFVDGMHFFDGGYFTSAPRIEVSDDGVTWTTVATVTGYQGNAAPNFTAYDIPFTADGRYLRLIGTPAGGAEFSSIAELEVYGTVLPGSPNVNITVTGIPANPLPGDTVTVTVTATNIGDAGASGIVIDSPVPGGLTLVSATPSQGTYGGGTWTLGGLPAGGSQTLTLVLTVNAGTGGTSITHTATITSMNEPNPGTGTGSTTFNVGIPGSPNVTITVTVDNPNPTVGTNVTITIKAKNVGTAGATGVLVPWTLPGGLTLVSTTPNTGSPWNVGSLAVDEEQTLVIVATVTGAAGQPLVVNAGPVTCSQPCGSGGGSVTITPTVALAPAVTITVTVDNPTPTVGTNVTITIKAKNVGTAGATGVLVPWTLPAGLTLVSTTPSSGSQWNVGSLAVDEEKTLVIVATVTGAAGQPLVVNAGPVSCAQPCGNGGGNVTITPAAAPTGNGGWMNVGGNIKDGSKRYTWGGSISCDGISKKAFEYHDHYRNIDFNLSTVTSVVCSTTSGVSQGQPRAGFNTLTLVGRSSDGKRVEATFIDAGEPGRNDTVNIRVYSAGGTLLSSVSGKLDGGNLQAHKGDESYNSQGYDRDGYDRDGYDRDGYDRGGCDRSGRDRNDRDRGHGDD